MSAPLSPARRVVLALGGILVLLAVAWAAVSAVAVMSRVQVERTTALAASPRLAVQTDAGPIDVRPSPDGKVHVTTVERYSLRRPRLTMRSSGGRLELGADCPSLSFSCSVGYTVLVPAATEVDVTSGGGDVSATDLTGPARLESSAGDVTATRMTGRLQLRSSAGDVSGRDLGTELDARSSAGDVDVSFAVAPTDVRAESSAGDVTVTVPGGPYQVDADASAGTSRITVPTDPNSPRRILAHSSAGDVEVSP